MGVLDSAIKLRSICQVVTYISLEKELGLSFIAVLLCKLSCLTASLFLCSITSLISNCLNLVFGTQERPRRLKPFFPYKQERSCHWGYFTRSCLISVPLPFLRYSSVLRESDGTRKGRKFWTESLIINSAENSVVRDSVSIPSSRDYSNHERQVRGSLLPSPLPPAPISASALPQQHLEFFGFPKTWRFSATLNSRGFWGNRIPWDSRGFYRQDGIICPCRLTVECQPRRPK